MLKAAVSGVVPYRLSLSALIALRRRREVLLEAWTQRVEQSEVAYSGGHCFVASGLLNDMKVCIKQTFTRAGWCTCIGAQLPIHLRGLAAWVRCSQPKPKETGAEREVGDPEFGRVVRVAGPAAVVTATLTEGARARLAGFFTHRSGRVLEGWVESRTSGLLWSPSDVEDELDVVVRLVRALKFPAEQTVERLAHIARQDVLLAVRDKALRRLIQDFPEAPQTADVLTEVLAQEDNRLEVSARLVDPQAGPHIVRVVMAKERLSSFLRARALGWIAHAAGRSDETSELVRFLRSTESRIQFVAAEALADIVVPTAAAELHALAHRPFTAPEVRRAASRALRAIRQKVGMELSGSLSLCTGATGSVSVVGSEPKS